jgi:hypothetical protein
MMLTGGAAAWAGVLPALAQENSGWAEGGVKTKHLFVSKTGSDEQTGENPDKALKNINSAIERARPGDTITVSEGEYPETLEVTTSNLTFIAEGEVKTKSWSLKGDGITLRGFDISDPQSTAGVYVFGNDNLVEGNTIHDTLKDGFHFSGKKNIFRRNKVFAPVQQPESVLHRDDNSGTNFSQTSGAEDTVIEGNWFHNPNTSGSNRLMEVRSDSNTVKDLTIRGNIFIVEDEGNSPIWIHRQDDDEHISGVSIYGNVFYNRTLEGGSAVSASNIRGLEVFDNFFAGYGAGPFPYVAQEGSTGSVRGNVMVLELGDGGEAATPVPEGTWLYMFYVRQLDRQLLHPGIIDFIEAVQWLPWDVLKHHQAIPTP